MTFRKLLDVVAKAYDVDVNGDSMLLLFDQATGKLIEGARDEAGDGLLVFIAVELKEVIFAPHEFDAERELTAEEIEAAVQAMATADNQVNRVYGALLARTPVS